MCGRSSAQIIPDGFLERHSIYVDSETSVEVLVDAALSYYDNGAAYEDAPGPVSEEEEEDRLVFSIAVGVNTTDNVFAPLVPYGFYGSYSGYFNATGSAAAYAAAGFNALHPVVDFADANRVLLQDGNAGDDGLDVAYWSSPDVAGVLVGVVNPGSVARNVTEISAI